MKCSLEENCLAPNIFFQAEATNDIDHQYNSYYGLAESSFKKKGLEVISNRLIIDMTRTKQNCLNASGQ